MTPSRDPAFEATLVKLMAWLKARNCTAHTRRGQTLIIMKKGPKK